MARKSEKNTATRNSPKRWRFWAIYLCAGVLTALLGFISLELAALWIGFVTLSSVVALDRRGRKRWENATSFRVKYLGEQQKSLERDIKHVQKTVKALEHTPPERKLAHTRLKNTPSLANKRPRGPVLRAKKPQRKITRDNAAYDYLSDTVIRELMYQAVGNNDIKVFAQPIMRLPQRHTRFYEVFARLRARHGVYIPAARYLSLAQKENLVSDIDQLLLAHCLKAIEGNGAQDQTAPFFINVTAATLANLGFMKQLLGFLSKNRGLAGQLVLEIHQKDFENMNPAILQILRGLGQIGCALSLDHVERFEFDLKFLQVLKVRFVKFNAASLLKRAHSETGATDIWRMKRKLEGNGIGFIAEKIEDEYTLKELLDFDLHYGQGYLLGRPELLNSRKQTSTFRKRA